jgi:hypothetical protein
MRSTIAASVDQDERVVEDVHCSECGLPISTIPNWYASVNVKFTCDSCRQKAPRLGTPIAVESDRSAEDADSDPALDEEDSDEEIEIDDSDDTATEEDAGDDL